MSLDGKCPNLVIGLLLHCEQQLLDLRLSLPPGCPLITQLCLQLTYPILQLLVLDLKPLARRPIRVCVVDTYLNLPSPYLSRARTCCANVDEMTVLRVAFFFNAVLRSSSAASLSMGA